MPLHWRPVGPEPASTYWLRRALVAAGALLLLALLVPLLGGDDDDADTLAGAPTSAPSPSLQPSVDPSASADPSSDPSASPSASPSATTACEPTSLEVEPSPDEDSYAAGAGARLSLSITNTGSTPCTRDLGQAQVELTVTSGSDRIWSSDDCAPGGDPDVVRLVPGTPVVQSVTWDGRRSLPGCAGDRDQAQPGTYRVSGRVGDLRVDGGSFTLTG
ncbi:hypothetical protein BH24ACT10_BH24ACT10_06010 [soil metagenome]